jgi:hypothetical protein
MRIAVPFTYVSGSAGTRTPEYILITMTGSGDQAGGTANTALWVDEMKVTNTSTGISDLAQISVRPYFQNNNLMTDLTGQNLTDASLQLFNMSGQMISEQSLNGNGMNISTVNASAGVYIFRIISAQATATGKVVKQ